MKNSSRYFQFILALIVMAGLFSCEKTPEEPGTGRAEFSIDLPDNLSQLKSDNPDDSAIYSFHVLVSIEDEDGNPVLTDELIPLYHFGTGYVSESLELKTGHYQLVKFMVINPGGEVIFASPLEGSPLAYLVDDPLPVTFRVFTNQVTIVVPEVLPVGDYPPEEFGYVSFGVNIVRPLHFYAMCILENPWTNGPIQITDAKLTVFGPGNWHYTFHLEAKVNHLVIRGGAEVYHFLLEKEGYDPQKFEFTAGRLLATTTNDPLILRIPVYPYHLLVFQPGPEEGIDAMITNLDPDNNYGDHKYFEATFLSEPILTVMRTNRSLINFRMDELPWNARIKRVKLRLYYEEFFDWDSTWYASFPDTIINSDYAAVLQRVTEPWSEDEVTWNTQPNSTEYNQVKVYPFSVSNQQIEVDVTRLFVPNDGTFAAHYGLMFRQYPNEFFPGLRYASSDYPVPEMRPKLLVYYTIE